MTRPTNQRQAGSGWRAAGRAAAAATIAATIAATLVFPAIGAGTAAASAAAHRAGRAAATGGSLRDWGLNDFGQLGNGTTTSSDTPVKVQLPPGTRVTSMRAGCGHTLALTTTGHVLAWGDNSDGELGDGTTTDSDTPVKVKLPPGTKVKAIRAGCLHSLALTTTGHVLAWGFNAQGELGNAATTNSDTPVKVKLPNGTKVKAISAGAAHSLAFTRNGRLYAWGFNGEGELGDGTTTDSDTPVRVKLPRAPR
jgi:alpha-tubulin suppressor-like RCC1 family protein